MYKKFAGILKLDAFKKLGFVSVPKTGEGKSFS